MTLLIELYEAQKARSQHRTINEWNRRFRQLPQEYSLRMSNLETETSVVEAVGFLSSRVAEQVRKDSVPLTKICTRDSRS